MKRALLILLNDCSNTLEGLWRVFSIAEITPNDVINVSCRFGVYTHFFFLCIKACITNSYGIESCLCLLSRIMLHYGNCSYTCMPPVSEHNLEAAVNAHTVHCNRNTWMDQTTFGGGWILATCKCNVHSLTTS